MGTYRLLLAILVALSHMEVTILGYNGGVFAVVSFLIISGYVMTALIKRNYQHLNSIPAFYIDRAIRLYPQFLLYFSISCFLIWAYLPAYNHEQTFTSSNIISSLAIAPLDLYMFGITAWDVLPPAWSLGLEAFFYAVIPFLLIWKIRAYAFALSVIVFAFACLGYIHSDIYGYRLIPGVLFMFLCGSYIYQGSSIEKRSTYVAAACSLLAFISIALNIIPRAPYNAEVTAGLAIGVPVIYALSKLGRHKVDEFLGNISYGVFLSHFVVIRAAEVIGYKIFDTLTISIILIASFVCSGMSYYLIERPALRLRRAIRYKSTDTKNQKSHRLARESL